jgi:hypothetical protein
MTFIYVAGTVKVGLWKETGRKYFTVCNTCFSLTDASPEYQYSRSICLWTRPGTEFYTKSSNVSMHLFKRAWYFGGEEAIK